MVAAHEGPVIVIGDSPADITAARNSGCAFIGFVTTPGRAQTLRDAGVTALFSDFSKLPALIAQAERAATPDTSSPAAYRAPGGPGNN